jgi:hypothetical protein
MGLPDLPGPPSSDEEDVKTPVKPNGEAKPLAMPLSTMKTPRCPGAFGTPALLFVPAVDSTPEEYEPVTSEEGEPTPKLVPVNALPPSESYAGEPPSPASVPPTPVPPGAYRATPMPAKRKGILKVRFDGDVQTSEGLVNDSVNGAVGAAKGAAIETKETSSLPSPSSEDIPPLNLSPSRRKGLRLVDEYGRERRFTEDGEEIVLESRRKNVSTSEESLKPTPTPVDDGTLTPRRRAKMRQVDALGNEIMETDEPKEEPKKEPNGRVNGELPEPRGKKALFSRLTRSLGELQDDLAEEEDACVILHS